LSLVVTCRPNIFLLVDLSLLLTSGDPDEFQTS
jgi:hypothetical protein